MSAPPTRDAGALSRAPLPARVRVTPDLLTFRRDGRLLLSSTSAMRPLLAYRGGAQVQDLVGRVGQDADTRGLLETGVPRELLHSLITHRIIRDATGDNRPPAATRKPAPADKSRGISLYLLLSQGCNLGCVYCLNGEGTYQRARAPKMAAPVAFQAVERCLERLEKGGQLQVVFFGGEPLLNWPVAEEVMRHVHAQVLPRYPGTKVHFHVTSNLSSLPAGFIDSIRRNGISVLCDVDGPPELHDLTRPFKNGRPSSTRIRANLSRLAEAGIAVALRATITSHNVDRMGDIARYHKEIGGSGTSAVPVNAVNSDEAILGDSMLPAPEAFAAGLRDTLQAGFDFKHVFPFNQFARTLRPDLHNQTIGCGAAYGNTPVVGVEGDVYACIYLVGIEAYKIGNVYEPAFPDMEVLARMMDLVRVDHIQGCKDCLYRHVCVGGVQSGPCLSRPTLRQVSG